jgi:hypothetical protein
MGVAETVVGIRGGEVGEYCHTLLHDFFLQAQSPNKWLWRLDHDRGYSVLGVYQLLTSHPLHALYVEADLI